VLSEVDARFAMPSRTSLLIASCYSNSLVQSGLFKCGILQSGILRGGLIIIISIVRSHFGSGSLTQQTHCASVSMALLRPLALLVVSALPDRTLSVTIPRHLQRSCSNAAGKEEAEEEEDDADAAALTGLLQKAHYLVPNNIRLIDPPGESQAKASSEGRGGGTVLLDAALPFAWIHFPKTGTSLVNALLNLPGVCPGQSVPYIDDNSMKPCEEHPTAATQAFVRQVSKCTGIYEFVDSFCKHNHLDSALMYKQHYLDHMAAMFRQPEQRILSAWYHCQRNCEKDNVLSTSLEHFAKLVQGTYVRELNGMPIYWSTNIWFTGPACVICLPAEELLAVPPPTAAQVAKAVERVREGYAFVGITEQWDLSMCLLHKMFGGKCSSTDFENSRPNPSHEDASSGYNTSILEGFTDQYDGPVFAEAEQIFREHLQRFDVSYTSCEACFAEAGGL